MVLPSSLLEEAITSTSPGLLPTTLTVLPSLDTSAFIGSDAVTVNVSVKLDGLIDNVNDTSSNVLASLGPLKDIDVI